MKQKKFWLRTLNVRTEEWWLVKKLFLLQFLQGAGIAFFFTSAFALFLARIPITKLPWVFIFASILLWIIGFIYSKVEHAFYISKVAIIVTIFMAVSMLFFRLAFAFIQADWILYLLLAWYNVLYLLNNLEFWGLASLLFDARQSKRLFGVISAGDIPAKFIGYTLALFTVEFIGTINLLWAGTLCMLASIPYLVSIEKSGKLHEVHHKKKHTPKHSTVAVRKIVKNFSGNALIMRLATLSIIVTASFIIINFAFYAGVKEAYHDDVSLAKFIAFFLAIVRIVALIVKMIVTGRLINKLGIIKSLLVTPVVMLILIFIVVLSQNLDDYQKIILYVFGATSIVVDILRSAINSPVFLTIMQPLPNHDRLRAHTIVKGITDPFASLLSGVILLILIHYQHRVDLLTLSYLLLIICFLWIISIYRVNSQYLATVLKTISSRYFNQESFSLQESGNLDWLKEKTKNGSETEVINILNMLYNSDNGMPKELIVHALQHPSEKVKTAALKLIEHRNIPHPAELLQPFLHHTNRPEMIATSIYIMCRNGIDNQIILPYLNHEHQEVRRAAITGLLSFGTDSSKLQTTSILADMANAIDPAERLMAAETLSNLQGGQHVETTLQLMKDPNPLVRKTAFLAAGKSGNVLLLRELMNSIAEHEAEIIQPLLVAGETALPLILCYINSENATRHQKEKLILLSGTRASESAREMLVKLLSSHPAEFMVIIKALYRSKYAPRQDAQVPLISLTKQLFTRCASIIYMQSSLVVHKRKDHLLYNALDLELLAIRECLLYIFAMLYDREHVNRVRTAYATGKKSDIINAMEIIDIAVRKDLANSFNTIFEPGNISERMHDIQFLFPFENFSKEEDVINRILSEENRPYNNWTIACCLYMANKNHLAITKNLITKYLSSENLMIRETALIFK